MTVSRFDVTEFIGDAFSSGPVAPGALVRVAERRGARPAVLDVLRRLPGESYARLDDVFDALPRLPDDTDPWTMPPPS
jgi:hypothetical protein